jgi:hypothetical protein
MGLLGRTKRKAGASVPPAGRSLTYWSRMAWPDGQSVIPVTVADGVAQETGFVHVDVLRGGSSTVRKIDEVGPRLYRLDAIGHDPVVHRADEQDAKMLKAIQLGAQWGDRIPIGVFYENSLIPTYEERIAARNPSYRDWPPSKERIAGADGRTAVSFDEMLKPLRV